MRPYNPLRKKNVDSNDPLEIELVYNVSSCGTCSYFWPKDVSKQPYGPYPCFDFTSNTPSGNSSDNEQDYSWLTGITTDPGFPTGEIMDGCRKAPIMTIGINPNLTAFLPGQQGTSWAYPNFTSNNGNDMWTKYAYYYRYRSVYQEHFNFADVIKNYIVSGSQVKAKKSGVIMDNTRTSDNPDYSIKVKYDGESGITEINFPGVLGEPPYVLLFNLHEKFNAGDIIGAQLNIPGGINIDVYQGTIGYYEQFMPSLKKFQQYLVSLGITDANLQIGEDVCQLDMVACASPHWTDQYLGGSQSNENTVINNCVSKNAWAIKQLVQTKPVVLFLVGEASYEMFQNAFSHFIKKNTPLPVNSEDGAFTLFKATLNDNDPCMFEFSTVIGGQNYSISTRLIVTPHFSYDYNFWPQFRMSQQQWKSFQNDYSECYTYLFNNPDIQYIKPINHTGYVSVAIVKNSANVLSTLNTQYNEAYQVLKPLYYDPHNDMANVLVYMHKAGELTYVNPENGEKGYLKRTDGACQFCVNNHWHFPLGCPYNKPAEIQPPTHFLQEVTRQIIANAKPAELLSKTRFKSLFTDQ